MEALVGTVEAVRQDPSLGAFEFRATNQWINGGENRSRIKEFYGAGIQIERLSTELVGTLDVQGLLALDDTVPVGYEQIQINMDIKADCSDDELDELLAFAKNHSPVCNTVCRPVPVTVKRVQ
jgi:hypothetical protein